MDVTSQKTELTRVNEHFELIFNAVWSSAGNFQAQPSVLFRKFVEEVASALDRQARRRDEA